MTYWYERPHAAQPWMPGDRQCRCGSATDHPIHGTPRMDLRIVLEAALVVVALFVIVAAASTGFVA